MTKPLYTVGEFAEKMKVSVRTLQYYDKQGLLKPTSYSKGGRRLYSSQDAITLQQILSLKFIGLSLEEIKEQLLNQAAESNIKSTITRQIAMLEGRVLQLRESLSVLKIVEKDLQNSDEIDPATIADAIYLIRSMEEKDWLKLNDFEENLRSHIESRSDSDQQFQLRLARDFESISNQMVNLVQKNVDPTSDAGQSVARKMWEMIQDFTDGDMSILPQLIKFQEDREKWPDEMRKRQELIDGFMGKALAHLLENTQNISVE